MASSGEDSPIGQGAAFPSTRWSLVERASVDDPSTREALETLLRQYWRPVFCYVRSGWARTVEDAEDLVQGFFASILEKASLKEADPERGRFRGFLKAMLRHFLLHQKERESAQKRGKGKVIPLDDLRDCPAPAPDLTPEQAFDREWARQLLREALADLRQELTSEGKPEWFAVLEKYDLSVGPQQPTYAQAAEALGLTESDVRNYLHYVRARLRRAVRMRIQDTVADPEQLEREIGELFG